MTLQELLALIKKNVPEISVHEAAEQQKSKAIILDVRETNEWNEGHIPGAIHAARGTLELKIEKLIADKETQIICHCGGGTRSLLAARTLKELGYTHVSSMAGGFRTWKQEGFPIEVTQDFSEEEKQFYSRHFNLPEVKEEGQKKLKTAKVLIVGAGGLGSPSAFYLAAAGIGTLGIIDFDIVELSNLQRQILHRVDRVGKLKVDSAKQTLNALNPHIKVVTFTEALTLENAGEILANFDIIVDGSDNFKTRYLINDICCELKKPFVHGSVLKFEGHIGLFWPGKSPCYRCLFAEAPPVELAPSCAEAGVLGVLPGVIGTLQAMETLKWILEKETWLGQLMIYNALKGDFRKIKLDAKTRCAHCR